MAKASPTSISGKPKASPAAIWGALAIIYIVWGSTYLAIRFAVQTIPPFLMVATRFLVAGSLLFATRRAAGDPLPTRREWLGSAILGGCLLVGGTGGITWAEQSLPSGLVALMVSSSPLWMLLLEWVLPHGNKPKARTVIGIIAGFSGIVLLFWPGDGSLLTIDPHGAVVVLLATLFWAFGTVYSRKLHLPRSPMMGTAAEMLTGGSMLLLAGSLTGEFGHLSLQSVSMISFAGLVYLMLIGSLVAFSAYNWLLRVAPTSLVGTYAYVNPLVALVLGFLIGNESIGPRTLFAAVIIIGSVALTTLVQTERPPDTQPIDPE